MSYCSFDKNSILNYIDENKLLSCLTTFTFAVIGLFLYILSTYTFFEKRKIPRAVRPTVPYGNFKEVLCQNTTLYVYLWKYYNRFRRKGCKFGGLYLFFRPCVLMVNPTLINKVVAQEKCFVDACKRKPLPNYKNILNIFNDETLECFLENYNRVKENITKNIDEEGVISGMHNFFLETSCLAFGFKDRLALMDLINDLLEVKTRSTLRYYFCLVYPLFKRGTSSVDKQTLLKTIVEGRKKNDIREKDLLQGFIDLLIENNDYDTGTIATEIFDIFVDNIIHSSSILLFCLYELACNEDIQLELMGEIRRFKKDNKPVNLDNLHHLIYLDAVVKETLRKYPPVPTVIKECKEAFKNSEFGLDLPKGTLLFATIIGVHRNETNFMSPENFDPDRFLDENRKYIKPNTYNPFGHELRKHIGLRFTTIHVKLALIVTLSSYRIFLTDAKHNLEFDSNKLHIHPKTPLPLRFEALP